MTSSQILSPDFTPDVSTSSDVATTVISVISAVGIKKNIIVDTPSDTLRLDHLTCGICNDLLDHPYILPCQFPCKFHLSEHRCFPCPNQHSYCNSCLSNSTSREKRSQLTCPSCRDPQVTSFSQGFMDIRSEHVMSDLQLTCQNEHCTWIGKLGFRRSEYKKHLQECDYVAVKCSCGASITRIQMNLHLERDCPKTMISCENHGCLFKSRREEMSNHLYHSFVLCIFCKRLIERDQLQSHDCLNCPIVCENKCGYVFIRGDEGKKLYEKHKSTCSGRIVTCPFGGCSWVGSHAQLDGHLNHKFHAKLPSCKHNCGLSFRHQDVEKQLTEHELQCDFAIVSCPLGCSWTGKRGSLAQHQAENVVSHINFLASKLGLGVSAATVVESDDDSNYDDSDDDDYVHTGVVSDTPPEKSPDLSPEMSFKETSEKTSEEASKVISTSEVTSEATSEAKSKTEDKNQIEESKGLQYTLGEIVVPVRVYSRSDQDQVDVVPLMPGLDHITLTIKKSLVAEKGTVDQNHTLNTPISSSCDYQNRRQVYNFGNVFCDMSCYQQSNWRHHLKVGDLIDVEDHVGKFYLAKITLVYNSEVYVHFARIPSVDILSKIHPPWTKSNGNVASCERADSFLSEFFDRAAPTYRLLKPSVLN